MKLVHEFAAGKHDWNTFEVGVEDEKIVIRDETGRIEFEDKDVDELIQAIDQARRRLREDKRRPTGKAIQQVETGDNAEPAEDALDRSNKAKDAEETESSDDEETDEPEDAIMPGHNPLER